MVDIFDKILFLPWTYNIDKHKELALNDHYRSVTLSVYKWNQMDP